jgi:hypothetical protein
MSTILALHMMCVLAIPQDTANRAAGWRSDLQVLLREARRVHAGPTKPAHRPGFQQAVTALSRRVPGVTDERLVAEVQRVMAMLGDGHSLVYMMSTPRVSLTMLPVDLYWFAEGVYVIGGVGEGATLIGNRVVRIGGRPVEDLLREIEPYVSRDNAMAVRVFGPVYLTYPTFLGALGVRSADGVEFMLSDSRGRARTVTLRAGPARRHPRKLNPPARASVPPPMYMENFRAPFWMRRLPEHQAVYFQFNQVMDGDRETLAQFARRLADTLSTPATRNVIVDVRLNNGGNNGLLRPLIETLVGFERAREGNRIFVLTSRGTFSAAQNFITRLERAAHPVFAGERSMSSPNFTGEDNEVVLPYSGLRLSISNNYWQDSDPKDNRPWIEPRIPVSFSAAAYFANEDPVLPVVLREIASARAGR